ncbi:hypothetical protein BGZ80_004740 [Entomortierella chlamydospora]|uniref:Uncharacterized protein n=1 Tax=Entomortierella chlamydospora TaxID=101097 RepID=A0A9P6MM90_9FUNG|nr:hypothetical protein BGZ80_004740 [Entomortierella chlamydospora]
MDKDWENRVDITYETEFFRQQDALRKLLKGRGVVHNIADQVINKRQRIELENELRSHDEKHHPGGSVGKALASRQQIGACNIQESTSFNDDNNDINCSSDDDDNDYKLTSGQRTPQRSAESHFEKIPQVKDLEAVFHHVADLNNFKLSDVDQDLYDEATLWFQSNNGRDIETVIQNIRNDPFWEPWINDLLYDRLKLLRYGLNPQADENTYTSYWVIPDFTALQTGVPGLISKGSSNENHFVPSSWRRALVRDKTHSKGTNVDAYYVAMDDHVDIIFENVGSPTCTDHVKHAEDKEKSFRNAADALLERFYNTSGSFEIAKEYRVIIVIVFVYTVGIKDPNEFVVTKILQEKYHLTKGAYLTKILLHLKFCLTIKTIMEKNIDTTIKFGESLESVRPDEQAHFNLRLHKTPVKERTHRQSLVGGSKRC